jgi:hypothetical protein
MGTKNHLSSTTAKTFPPAASNGTHRQQQVGRAQEARPSLLPRGAEVADAVRWAEELTAQWPGDPAAFVAATEILVQANEEKRIGEALVVVNQRARSIVGSRQAEQEAWALAAAVAVYQQKEVVEVAEDAARQAVLQS